MPNPLAPLLERLRDRERGTALILALLAIPLSFVNPRAGRSVNLLFALLAGASGALGAIRSVLRLTPAEEIERLPDLARARMEILGIGLPLILLDPQNASAPARLRAALDQFITP